MYESLLASSAVPIYLPSARIGGHHGARPRLCIDGALFQHNPVAAALKIGRKNLPASLFSMREMTILSLGTGGATYPFGDAKLQNAGAFEWISPLIGVTVDGASQATHHCYQELFGEHNYYRIDLGANCRNIEVGEDSRIREIKESTEAALRSPTDGWDFNALNRFLNQIEKEEDFMRQLWNSDYFTRERDGLRVPKNRIEILSVLEKWKDLYIGINPGDGIVYTIEKDKDETASFNSNRGRKRRERDLESYSQGNLRFIKILRYVAQTLWEENSKMPA